ncbi:MAG: lysyl-tRNA synthetase, class, partial [Thermoleophilaceae bacterium]|nr:lysyl-tRNA synthetase, class [Thermoleophilaceae bacterium]
MRGFSCGRVVARAGLRHTRPEMTHPTDARRRPAWLPPLAAFATALVGLFNVGSALTPDFAERARLLLHAGSAELLPLAHALALSSGVTLLVLSAYLARRRRRAVLLTIAVLAVAGAFNVVKGLDVEEALACWGLAALLWWGRSTFVVRHEPGLGAALRIVPALVALIAGASFVVVWVASVPGTSAGRALHETLRLLLLMPEPHIFRHHFGWVDEAVGIMSVGTLVAIAWTVFRPLAPPARRSAKARRDAESLVRAHGSDTLSFFKLRQDKHYLFSRDGRAFAGYRIESGVMMVSGDPVGPPDALAALASEVRSFAEVRGLRVAVLGASEAALDLWRPHGLRSIYIGDEAVVETAGFSLDGRAIRKIRQSVTRMGKAGFTAEVSRLGDLDEHAIGELEGVSERWRAGDPERGFSMA